MILQLKGDHFGIEYIKSEQNISKYISRHLGRE